MNHPFFFYSGWFFAMLCMIACKPSDNQSANPDMKTATYEEEFSHQLKEGLLDHWYPAIIDEEAGGYLSDMDREWKPNGEQRKMIVTQARHLWMTSKAGMFYPDKQEYRQWADHGFAFIRDHMWDTLHGGFFYLVDRQGEWIPSPRGDDKWAYGNAFAIFGLAAYHKFTGSVEALELAKETFKWLEAHSYDPVHKGHLPFMNREGQAFGRELPVPEDDLRLGYKDQNPTIHLLEAFAELYPVWDDPVLRERFKETLLIVRDTITRPKGYMQLYFTPEWEPVSYKDSSDEVREAHYGIDHVSFGHDIETAFLLLEAAELLSEDIYQETMPMAKKMVDHSLEYGFDWEHGGIYEQGYYFPEGMRIVDERKNWWAQAEGLHSLVMFSGLYPENTDYPKALELQWAYIKQHIIDPEYGGWYSFGTDHSPQIVSRNKANIWKSSYHNGRALMFSLKLLDAKK